MIDVLPRFTEMSVRMRAKHMAPLGSEVVIIRPQGIQTSRLRPNKRLKDLTDGDLKHSRFDSPSIALFELSYKLIYTWLNEDPLLWCQYGAKFVVHKVANTYPVALYPFPVGTHG